jgi:hypothetical protein
MKSNLECPEDVDDEAKNEKKSIFDAEAKTWNG